LLLRSLKQEQEPIMSTANIAHAPSATESSAEKVVIPVTGMTCAACQGRVQRTLSKSPGVVDASVNLMMGNATVAYDPATTSPEVLVERSSAPRDTARSSRGSSRAPSRSRRLATRSRPRNSTSSGARPS
jgi:cation transport ATPase